ncbi:hypothetical protein CsSME_00038549 [Camellia sinensis var. sinensis]
MNKVQDTKVELLTRKEHCMATIAEGSANFDSNLVEWIINLVSTSFSLQDVIDDTLIGLGFDGEIFEFMNIACKCVQSVQANNAGSVPNNEGHWGETWPCGRF